MIIQVSGKRTEVEDGITVMQLMVQQQVETPQYVTVALNNVFLLMEKYDSHVLQDGDVVEFLYYMGGGRHGSDR